MKRIYYLLSALLISTITYSQNFNQHRYSNKIFTNADTAKGIQYATAPWLNNLIEITALADYNIHEGESTTEVRPLLMDIFTPKTDTVSKRPAIVFVHGGAFLLGSRHNEDMIALCDSFAKMGYVTASIQYRLGVGAEVTRTLGQITNVNVSEDNFGRSVYRGIQDGRAAVRFLTENAVTYNIDPNLIYMVGSSAGGFVTIHNIYMDKSSEIPTAATLTPNLGGLDEIGNIGTESRVKGIVALWGAIQSTTIIENDDTPSLLIHGIIDDTVPFKAGIPLNGVVPQNPVLSFSLPETFGSYCIDTALTNSAINHETYFVEEQGHEFYGVDNGDFTNDGPNNYWDTIFNKTTNFLFNQHKPTASYSYSNDELIITFSNTSTNGVYYKWIFGDTQESLEENPTHAYATGGKYTVLLITQNQHQAWDTISKIINVGYTATFIVKSGESFIEGALVKLANYGTITTGTNGLAEFTNVALSDSISYEVTAIGYKKVMGKVIVTNSDITKIVNLSAALYSVKFVVTIGSSLYQNAVVNFTDYGIQQTDVNGETTFLDVTPGFGLKYKVTISSYSPYESALNVIDTNVVEEVTFSEPSYNVIFMIKSGDKSLEGATVSIQGYGEKNTDANGNAKFLNIEQAVNIPYTVSALWHDKYTNTIDISQDTNIYVFMTDVAENIKESLNIWPNPNKGIININFTERGYIQIISSTGKIIYSDNVDYGDFIYQVQSNEKGLFLVQFSSNNRPITKKIVVN